MPIPWIFLFGMYARGVLVCCTYPMSPAFKLVLLLCITSVLRSAPSAPTALTVNEGRVNPLGFHDPAPRFSWKLQDERFGARQTACQIQLFRIGDTGEALLWDTGKKETDSSTYIPYTGPNLHSRERVAWQVRVWDKDGVASPWSDRARFELGLLRNVDWQARWIHDKALADRPPAKLELKRATLTASGMSPVDLTSVLAGKLAEKPAGSPNIKFDLKALGVDDPAPGKFKTLQLDCLEEGAPVTVAVREGSPIVLPLPHQRDVVFFRKEFSILKPTERARLYITARGIYDVSINGRRVNDDAFAPGWTDYARRIETLTYDVTSFLQPGANVVAVRVASGWYSGDISPFGKYPELLAQLEVVQPGGAVQRIMTDNTWTSTTATPFIRSSIYWGEDYDANRELAGWDRVGFKGGGFAQVDAVAATHEPVLQPKRFQTVRQTLTLEAKSVKPTASGTFIFDLGQNMVGWPALRMPVLKGQLLRLRVAEMLEKDGTLYTDNYRAARSEVTYLPAQSGLLEWHPAFSFFGFRYVEVSGFDPSAKPDASWVRGLVLHTDFPRTGSFTSSHEMLNRLASNIEWGQRGNFLDIPTDCPQRNERLGWTGDAQVFSPVGLYQFDSHAFFMGWVQSLREAQTPDGSLPNVVPARGAYGGKVGSHGSAGWTDALVIIPWNVYVQTGDSTILRESFEAMCRLVDFDEALYSQNGFKTRQSYGDWLQPKFIPEDGIQNKPNNTAGQTPKELIGACYLGHTAGICAKAARVLGRTVEAAKYEALEKRMRGDVSARYFNAEGKLTTKLETQTGYLLPLAFGLLDEGLVPQVRNKLSALVKADGDLLNTGFLGTPHINRVLDEAGCTGQALNVLFTRSYPSWFYSIDQGATTMWERWNSYSHDMGFGPVSMNSFNHYAYGVIGQWIVERLVGLAPDPERPGYRNILVRPLLQSPLTMARANLETRYGPAETSWTRTGDIVRLTVLVPPNATATVRLPAAKAGAARWTNAPGGKGAAADAPVAGEARFEVPAGRHEFEITLASQ